MYEDFPLKINLFKDLEKLPENNRFTVAINVKSEAL